MESGVENKQSDTRQVMVEEKANTPRESNKLSEDLKKVTENLNSGDPDDLISKNYLELRRRDYRTLSGKNYVNGQVINEYFHLLQERYTYIHG